MKYQITSIQFDCSLDCEDDWSESDQIMTEERLNEVYVGQIWDADDEEDLIDEISTASGWCIKSIDYRHVLNWIMNRTELQDQFILQLLDDMDLKTMTQLCYDYLDEGYAKYSDEELITECEEYYPELLEA